MKREFIETPSFTKKWFSLGFNDEDLAELEQFLVENPEAGDMMVGTGGLRKQGLHLKEKAKAEVRVFAMLILQPLKKII